MNCLNVWRECRLSCRKSKGRWASWVKSEKRSWNDCFFRKFPRILKEFIVLLLYAGYSPLQAVIKWKIVWMKWSETLWFYLNIIWHWIYYKKRSELRQEFIEEFIINQFKFFALILLLYITVILRYKLNTKTESSLKFANWKHYKWLCFKEPCN